MHLGTAPPAKADMATLRTATPPPGHQEIVVIYTGDDAHAPSTVVLPPRAGE
ncbi:hypothetical protein [Streptomyces vinaceus]|uniref:hypothetical protein n=1 Tax=Streptomyces vinaceus TaxID=1960 RepID=UPI00381BF88C